MELTNDYTSTYDRRDSGKPCGGADAGRRSQSNPKVQQLRKAFMTDLSKKGPATLKLRDSHYFGDHSFEVGDLESIGAIREFELVANDAHDHHAIARAICAVNAQGDVVELR